jgi:Domain of unknown function (DUF3806)
MKQKLDKLTPKEEAWIASQLESAAKLVEIFHPDQAGQPITLAALDSAFAGFVAGNSDDIDAINGVINVVGTSFGQFLVDNVGLKWVIATDDEGSDLAVYGLPNKGAVLVYPANFVAKRWERRETNFLENSYQQIAEQMKALGNQAPREKSKPWWKPW